MKMLLSAPDIGAVLWAYLPEEGTAEKSKLRPVVVLDVSSRNGLMYATVAKGTSQHIDSIFLGEFIVHTPHDIESCGLQKPTKFQLRRREVIPVTSEWFELDKQSRLPTHLLKSLVAAAQEIHLI